MIVDFCAGNCNQLEKRPCKTSICSESRAISFSARYLLLRAVVLRKLRRFSLGWTVQQSPPMVVFFLLMLVFCSLEPIRNAHCHTVRSSVCFFVMSWVLVGTWTARLLRVLCRHWSTKPNSF